MSCPPHRAGNWDIIVLTVGSLFLGLDLVARNLVLNVGGGLETGRRGVQVRWLIRNPNISNWSTVCNHGTRARE